MRIPAVERKSQLIAATVELMKREGVQSVTMRAIAREANAPLATAHYCFSNKDELMDAAAEAWLKNLNRFCHDVPVNLGLRAAVEKVAEGYWRSLEQEPESLLAELELILWATRNADSNELATKIYPAYEVELGRIFAMAVGNSGDKCLISIPELVRCFLMVYDGAGIQYMTNSKSDDYRTLFFFMVDGLLTKAGL